LTEQGDWVYKWNAENRLIEAYSFAEDKKLEFIYDYLGRRVEKKVTQISTTTVTDEEQFLYDGWNLVAVYDVSNSNALVKTHTWGLDLSQTLQGAGGVGGLLGVEELTGTHQGVYAFAFDVNGNVSEVFNAAGSVVAHYEYSPFGEVIWSSGSYADANPYRFSTKYFDQETELYYYGYRYYDPATGKWLSKDPLQEEGGVNLTAFAGNSGINTVDLLGLCYTKVNTNSGNRGNKANRGNKQNRGNKANRGNESNRGNATNRANRGNSPNRGNKLNRGASGPTPPKPPGTAYSYYLNINPSSVTDNYDNYDNDFINGADSETSTSSTDGQNISTEPQGGFANPTDALITSGDEVARLQAKYGYEFATEIGVSVDGSFAYGAPVTSYLRDSVKIANIIFPSGYSSLSRPTSLVSS